MFSKTERFDIGKDSKYQVASSLLRIIAKQLSLEQFDDVIAAKIKNQTKK